MVQKEWFLWKTRLKLLNDDELGPFEYVLDNKVVEELQCLEETCSINDGSIVMLELGLLLEPDIIMIFLTYY